MARPLKWILWIVGVLVVIFVILTILALILLPPILKDALEKQLARITGGQVTVESVSAWPPGGATATNITVLGTRWPSIQSFGIARLEVYYNPFMLIGSHPEDSITNIRLLGFRVQASRKQSPHARLNQPAPEASLQKTDLPQNAPPPATAMMAASAEPLPQATAAPPIPQPPQPQAPPTAGNSRINIELAGGVLQLDDKEIAQEIHGEMILYDFDRLEGKIIAKALGGDSGNLTVRGDRIFSTNSGSTQITGDHLPLGPMLELTFLAGRVQGLGGSITIQAAVQDQKGKPDVYNVNLTLHQGQLAVMGIRSQIYEVNGVCSLGPTSAKLTDLEVKVGQWKVPFKVNGTVENFANPVVDLVCSTEKINLSDVTSLFNLENRNLLQGLALELVGIGKLVCTIKGPLAKPEVSLRVESISIGGYSISTGGKKGPKINLRLPGKKR